MLKTMNETKHDAIMMVADLMAAAALTAPKGSGKDTIRTAIITGEEKDRLRDKMIDPDAFKNSLLYIIDNEIDCLKQNI